MKCTNESVLNVVIALPTACSITRSPNAQLNVREFSLGKLYQPMYNVRPIAWSIMPSPSSRPQIRTLR
jgi:hypothetical protein